MTDYKDRVSGWATDIDWSKAPEGATHWGPDNSAYVESWYKKCDGEWMCATYGSEWQWGYLADGIKHEREIELIPRPAPQWNGEGLPPVGTECEVLNNDLSNAAWEKCTILFSGKHRIVYESESCSERVGYRDCLQFRPIKTPAQIAAEEREAAAKAMRAIVTRTHPAECPYLTLYDAGYRKIKGEDQ